MERFKVVDGSQSCHCCFVCTVVDTTKPVMIGDHQYRNQFDPVCECFSDEEAAMICNALNSTVKGN